MPHAIFDIQLQQPAIFSLQSGSAGTPQGLDYIPGATLLGHVAARLYAHLDSTQAWTVFHSGKVRFGDALPLAGNHESYPIPISWHTNKGALASESGRLLADQVFDAARILPATGLQLAQLRHGYVTADGRWLNPTRFQTLKTAIDPSSGHAADGQLFGYEALASDQSFRATLSADEEVPAELWQQVIDALHGQVRLGRSRSAQFGLATLLQRPSSDLTDPACAGNELTLWLLSDLALEMAGQPCLQPHPALLGLPTGSQWLAESSFLRQRSYSPYNAYRRHYDSQRQVISRGSVLRYRLPLPLPTVDLVRLQRGIGLHIECGLGQLLVNPPLLMQAHPIFPATTVSDEETKPAVLAKLASSPLIEALKARTQRLSGHDVELQARELLARYQEKQQQALRYDPFAQPPERSQWGRLKQLASDLRQQPSKLATALFDENSGLLRGRSGWELRFGVGPDDTLAQWLQNELGRSSTPLPVLVGQLASLALHEGLAAPGAGEPGAHA